MRLLPCLAVAAVSLGAVGCGNSHSAMVTHVTPVKQMLLPDSMSLVFPAEKRDILGHVYDGSLSEPRGLASLGAHLRQNPCSEHLQQQEEKLETKVSDAWPISDPMVPLLGFEAYYGTSTHLFVILDAPKTIRAIEDEEYAACCAEADCGDGMVTAVYEGTLNLHPAMAIPSPAPPIVLIAQSGDALGLGLHDGKTFQGVVAVELSN